MQGQTQQHQSVSEHGVCAVYEYDPDQQILHAGRQQPLAGGGRDGALHVRDDADGSDVRDVLPARYALYACGDCDVCCALVLHHCGVCYAPALHHHDVYTAVRGGPVKRLFYGKIDRRAGKTCWNWKKYEMSLLFCVWKQQPAHR